jgi:hypothetical protein
MNCWVQRKRRPFFVFNFQTMKQLLVITLASALLIGCSNQTPKQNIIPAPISTTQEAPKIKIADKTPEKETKEVVLEKVEKESPAGNKIAYALAQTMYKDGAKPSDTNIMLVEMGIEDIAEKCGQDSTKVAPMVYEVFNALADNMPDENILSFLDGVAASISTENADCLGSLNAYGLSKISLGN